MPREKRLAQRRNISGEGTSGAGSRGHRRPRVSPPRDPPPQAPAPPPASAPRKIIPPRYADLADLMSIFPILCDFIDFQGWSAFCSQYHIYYPVLVQEFYGNMRKDGDRYVTSVRGTPITVKPSMFARALDIPGQGETMDMHVPLQEVLYSMTMDEDVQLHPGRKLNANVFPPLQRLLHHMMTTIFYPKGGSRDEVTAVHRFLFYCMFNGIKVNLPDLMFRLVIQCFHQPTRVLPYAAALTAVFNRFGNLDLHAEKGKYILQAGIYNRSFIMNFMGYSIEDDVVHRPRPGYSSSSEDEEDENEGEEEGEPTDIPPEGVPPAQPMDEEPPVVPPRAHPSPEYAERVDPRMDRLEEQVNTLRSDFAVFNLRQQQIQLQLEKHTNLLESILDSVNPRPPP